MFQVKTRSKQDQENLECCRNTIFLAGQHIKSVSILKLDVQLKKMTLIRVVKGNFDQMNFSSEN